MTTLSPPSVPDVQPKETSRPNRWWRFLRWWFRHWKLSLCLLALAGIGVGVLWLKSTSSTDTPLLSVERTTAIETTPEEVRQIRDIGQWELLSAATEEMVELHRTGVLHDDHLVCIYRGTLRLGINLHHASADWFRADSTTAILQLPPIELLDEDFIDEARSRSFYESGSWTEASRDALYRKAYVAMKKRCLNSSNIAAADQNATAQFNNLLRSMGFKFVHVKFENNRETKSKK